MMPGGGRRLPLLARLGAVSLAALVLAPAAAAAPRDERALAERHAPVVRLVEQEEECGPGEPFEPVDVEVLFDEPTVALRGPWGAGDVVEVGPSADDLAGGLYEYHLDFPGNALDPGCGYERWGRRLTADAEPTVYAHVATEPGRPGRLALQYWLYYVFNDWNNTHEGDWELIQLVFAADDAREALGREPLETGYSQHEGAERADWGDDKLEVVDGTHPVVYPAAGSHANFYEPALFLGSSGSTGVGCDDTSGPSRELRPRVHTIPSDPAAARRADPWIAFEGRWGELQRSIFNGPTGPNLKGHWVEPITWADGWRDRSYAVPGGGALGTGTTDFFCGAVEDVSNALRRLVDEPLPMLLLLAGLVALVVFLIARATWTPVAPLRLARRRAWGQVLSSSARMYVARLPLFLGIGLLALPVSLAVTLLQALLLGGSRVAGVSTEGEGSSILVFAVVVIGTTLTLFALGLVQAATVRALVEIDAGRPIDPLRAYRLAGERLVPLLVALLVAVGVVSLLLGSVLLLPVALVLALRWALIVPVVELEGPAPLAALRRSGRLVRRNLVKAASLIVVGAAIALGIGPFVGGLLIFATSAPLAVLNLVAGVVYALTMPLVALVTAYVYFDTRVREELAAHEAPPAAILPVEAELT